MKTCKNCNAQIDDNSKFCPECGSPVKEPTCPNCNSPVSSGAKFCSECGMPLQVGFSPIVNSNNDQSDSGISDLAEFLKGEIKEKDKLDAEKEKRMKKLKNARAFCVTERYDEAKKIYDDMISDDPEDIDAYIGIVRVVSKNFTVFDGSEIQKHIGYVDGFSKNINKENLDGEYTEYISKRDKFFDDEKRRKAEEERKRKEEAERNRIAEEKRKRQEEADRLMKAVRLKQEEEERKRKEEAERQRKAEEERKRKEEAERQRKADEERKKCEAEEQKRMLDKKYNDAWNYYYGNNGFTQDYNKAFPLFLEVAKSGDHNAQNFVGVCYARGYGVTKDLTEAVKWYLKAAEQGDKYAQFNLAELYYYGKGVAINYAEAVKWYTKCAMQGHARAQYVLGWCYYHGQGVTTDYVEGEKWYRKAAEQGNADAQWEVGNCYRYGHLKGEFGCNVTANDWYRKSVENIPTAERCYLLGTHLEGYDSVEGRLELFSAMEGTANFIEAQKWYRKAAEMGYSKAYERLK